MMGFTARHCLAVLSALALVLNTQAQFTAPKSDVNDLTESWNVGDQIPIALSGWKADGKPPATCDLWITSFEGNALQQRIAENITIPGKFSYNWHISLKDEQVKKDSRFILRLVSHVNSSSPSFPKDSPMMASKAFNIREKSTATSTKTFTSKPTGNTSSSTKPKKKKKNVGAIAGGVLGGLVVLILILVAVLFLLKRARKNKESAGLPEDQSTEYKGGATVESHEAGPESEQGAPGWRGTSNAGNYEPVKQTPH